MIAIRTLRWSALVLAAFAGCAKEPEPAATPSTDTAPAAASPAMAPAPSAAGDAATTPAPDMPKLDAPQPTPATKEEAKPDDKAAAVSLSAEEVAEIKKLPGNESALALKQLVCPVSGENLGSMGTPLKVTAEGQTFYLCCKGCSKDVKDDPAAVVAKLKK